jgi:hypothetical protein
MDCSILFPIFEQEIEGLTCGFGSDDNGIKAGVNGLSKLAHKFLASFAFFEDVVAIITLGLVALHEVIVGLENCGVFIS